MILSIHKILSTLDSLMAAKEPRQPVSMAELGVALNINPNDQLLLFYFMRDAKLLSVNRSGSSIAMPPEMKHDTVRIFPKGVDILHDRIPDFTVDLTLVGVPENVARILLARKKKDSFIANSRLQVATE